MITVHISSNLKPVTREVANMINHMIRTSDRFLENEQPRILAHAQAIVRTTVYDVYEPVEYLRTDRLFHSIRAYFPNSSNRKLLYLDSDPDIAPAVSGEGGYPKYVAGEGPGIGFLQPFYGEGEDRRPSHFPRRFHDAWLNMSSNIYGNLSADLRQRYIRKVIGNAQRFMR